MSKPRCPFFKTKTQQNIFKEQNETNQSTERHRKFTTLQNKTDAIFFVLTCDFVVVLF